MDIINQKKICKVVHFTRDDLLGAGKAACRISNAISQEGVESEIYVLDHYSKQSNAISRKSWSGKCRRVTTRINWEVVKFAKPNDFFHCDKFGVTSDYRKIIADADVINLHWVNDGIWSAPFQKVLVNSGKPIVWTMHDMWPFTAGCHYDAFCAKYKNGCQDCPMFSTNLGRKIVADGSRLKEKLYGKANITLVGCSNWITSEAQSSSFCKKYRTQCVTINNPINLELYKMMDVNDVRRKLGIITNKKVILFGAVNALSDSRKGFRYLKKSIELLDANEYMLMVFGSGDIQEFNNNYEVKYLGEIRDEEMMCTIYNAADVFVAPSVQENLANTVLESLSCGTPVVAFDIGGMRDMIIPQFNGDLATPYDSKCLTQSIQYVATTQWEKSVIRDDVEKRFSNSVIGKQYIQLYKDIMGEG